MKLIYLSSVVFLPLLGLLCVFYFPELKELIFETFSEFCVYITKRKSEKSLDESFEFAIKFVFVDDFVRKFGFVDDLAQKKKSFLLLLLNLCFIFLLLFRFIGGLEKD